MVTSMFLGSLGLKHTVQPLMSLWNSGGTLLSVSSSDIGGAAVFEVWGGTGVVVERVLDPLRPLKAEWFPAVSGD